MSKFYETTNYIEQQIARKEREIAELRQKAHDAKIREFYWHIEDQCNAENQEFLNAPWEISFMGKSIELNNYANVWEAIHGLLIDYMDEDEIEYSRGENE
jgi:hypothetical protein